MALVLTCAADSSDEVVAALHAEGLQALTQEVLDAGTSLRYRDSLLNSDLSLTPSSGCRSEVRFDRCVAPTDDDCCVHAREMSRRALFDLVVVFCEVPAAQCWPPKSRDPQADR